MFARLFSRLRGRDASAGGDPDPAADSRRDFVERFRAAVQEVAASDILTQLSAGYGIKSAVTAFQERYGGPDGFLAQPLDERRRYLAELAEDKRQMTENGQVEAVGHGLFKTALTLLATETPDRATFRECLEILALLSRKATELIPRDG